MEGKLLQMSHLSRRQFLCALAPLTLYGCSRVPHLRSITESFEFALRGKPDVKVDRAHVTKLPYASIFAKLGKGTRSLLILGRVDGDRLYWYSAEHELLVTRNNLLVKTVGLQYDLIRTKEVGLTLTEALRDLSQPKKYFRTIDIMPGNHFGVTVHCEMVPVGRQTIEILELKFDTFLVKEINRVPTFDWEYTNFYWVDVESGIVWKSIQHIAPPMEPLEIQLLKPFTMT